MQRRLRTCIELPPRHAFGAASSISTDAPASRAISAEHKAALPPPMTTTSGIDEDIVMAQTIPSQHAIRAATFRTGMAAIRHPDFLGVSRQQDRARVAFR